MATRFTRTAMASLIAALALAGAAQAGTGHLGNVETIGIRTGMNYDEVKAALLKVKPTWKESGLQASGAMFEKGIGQIFKARFLSEDVKSSEELNLQFTKEKILFGVERVTRWKGAQRPAFVTAAASVREKYGVSTEERPYGESIQFFYASMDGGQTIAPAELNVKRNVVTDATKCFDFVKGPPAGGNLKGLMTQDVDFAKCGGYMTVFITADNPNYPSKGPREIAERMDISIRDPHVYLASAQIELQGLKKQQGEQVEKAKNSGIKPVL